MSRREIDEYLAGLDEVRRTTLEELRQTIRSIVPEAEDSGSVFDKMAGELAGYEMTKGALISRSMRLCLSRSLRISSLCVWPNCSANAFAWLQLSSGSWFALLSENW